MLSGAKNKGAWEKGSMVFVALSLGLHLKLQHADHEATVIGLLLQTKAVCH